MEATSRNENNSKPLSDQSELLRRYSEIRNLSEHLCEPLAPEDTVVQSMPEVSPTRWHLAHTTWFFETFVLAKAMPGYRPYHPEYEVLFNSYYNAVGPQYPRPRRGLLSRPTLDEIYEYRHHIDNVVRDVVASDSDFDLLSVVEVGLQHEQQHQELSLTDIKHVLSCNPLYPVYFPVPGETPRETKPLTWRRHEQGLYRIGHQGLDFSYDNERPRHRVYLEGYELANRLVTNGEFLEFIKDGGYQQPLHWLSEGWQTVCTEEWNAPLYWTKCDGDCWHFTLSGLQPVNPSQPVHHVSYFEADAFARWSGARLPTEAEWEVAAINLPVEGNFVESLQLSPQVVRLEADPPIQQMFGDVWEWTSSHYGPYPGYRALDGALGEYNGKFMCNQYVLRGGSCVTPRSHIRPTYRNFFSANARWQFSGIRLAR